MRNDTHPVDTPVELTVTPAKAMTAAELEKKPLVRSLVDTY